MPEIKLTYFNLPARGEPARLCFIYAGIDFEDKRIEFEEWEPMKQATLAEDRTIFKQPFLPWLEVDGDLISQSLAVIRYAAAISGLAGKTSLEKAKVDMVLGIYTDLLEATVKIMFSPPEKKEEAVTNAFEMYKKVFPILEKMLEVSGSGWLVGDNVTVADMAIFAFGIMADVAVLSQVGRNTHEAVDVPLLKANRKCVSELPKVKEYCEKQMEAFRKKTEEAKAAADKEEAADDDAE
ncbi:glutathione S-transferase 1-like [Glandiceps talaboti]